MATGIISFTLKFIISAVVALAMQIGMAMSAFHAIHNETIAASTADEMDNVPLGLADASEPAFVSWDNANEADNQ